MPSNFSVIRLYIKKGSANLEKAKFFNKNNLEVKRLKRKEFLIFNFFYFIKNKVIEIIYKVIEKIIKFLT